jgi:hypothetical protein
MNNQHPDMRRDALLRRALVPKGYRPTKDADIEKMLYTIGDEQISEERQQRMLRKINGKEPIFPDRSSPPLISTAEMSESERQLVALHRAQNKPLPPDLAAKLKAMEERASKKPKPGGESADG